MDLRSSDGVHSMQGLEVPVPWHAPSAERSGISACSCPSDAVVCYVRLMSAMLSSAQGTSYKFRFLALIPASAAGGTINGYAGIRLWTALTGARVVHHLRRHKRTSSHPSQHC